MTSREKKLAASAAAHHAVVDSRSAELAGFTPRDLRRRAAIGVLERLHADVYVVAGAPRTAEQQLLAACRAAAPDGVASHRSAAWLWGFDGFEQPGPVELTVGPGRRPVPRGAILHRTKRFDPLDVSTVNGIPATTRERTLVDLGAVVPQFLVRIAVESYLRGPYGSETKLRNRLEAVAGRGCRGVGVLRAVLDGRPDGAKASGSPIELAFLDICRRYGLEDPVAQHPIDLFDGSRMIVDWAWPQHRSVIEINGYEPHATRKAFEADHGRRLVLRELGYRYIEFTGKQLRDESLVLRTLRAEIPELWRSSTS